MTGKPALPGQPQADKFADLAHELECDNDEARFQETVKKVATSPHPTSEEAG